ELSFQQGYLGASPDVFVTGILHIRYTSKKPIFAKKILVSFVGKEYVFFTGTLEEAKRTIYKSSVCLWKSQSKGSYEGVNELDLPFRFKLPENLPPSLYVDRGCGRIYYMLKAIISRQPIDPDSRNYKKKIKVFCPIVRYTITPPLEPSRWLVKQEGPASLQAVGYDVSLSHSIFGSSECVVVPVKLVFYEPQIYLKKIFVGIKEYHELRTNKYETTTKRYIVEETVDARSIPISSGLDNEYSVDVKLSIPPSRNLAYSIDSTYITVAHRIKVKIHLGKAPNINLSKFINLRNIVSKRELPQTDVSAVLQRKLSYKPDVRPQIKKTDSEISKQWSSLSSLIPTFTKIHIVDSKNQKRISMMQLHLTDPDNPNIVFNSRSLICSK
ncbi:8308_t:CDS:2, partial [Cetraspora pellucida]